jgi:UDP-2,3-diacylglucosamine pyrophosphatase LpxH
MLWTTTRLNAALNKANLVTIPAGGRLVVASDLHLADGSKIDNFFANRERFLAFLDSVVRDEQAILLLLGDVEELWQCRIPEILQSHQAVYESCNRLPAERLIRIHGNHDRDLLATADPLRCRTLGGEETIRIEVQGRTFLFTHGHQGDLLNDFWRKPTEWVVRHFWTALERLHLKDPTGALPSHAEVQASTWDWEDVIRHRWAQAQGIQLVCGHTHRAVFASSMHHESLTGADLAHERRQGRVGRLDREKDRRPHYFNTGCGCYTNGFTTFEMTETEVRLWKWEQTEVEPKLYNAMAIADLPLKAQAITLSK